MKRYGWNPVRLRSGRDMDGLLRAIEFLRTLVASSYGPVGDEVLVFSPPDAPFITADGHAILRARREQSTAADCPRSASSAFERVILNAAEGVYRELGDGTTQFVILLHGMLNFIVKKEAGGRAGPSERAAIARALANLRQQWDAIQTSPSIQHFGIIEEPHPIGETTEKPSLQPESVLSRVEQILTTSLTGMLGRQVQRSIVCLVMQWVFSTRQLSCSQSMFKTVSDHLQMYLQQAPRAIIYGQHGSLKDSRVVSSNDFVLGKSLIPCQLPSLLNTSLHVSFVCVSGTMDLFKGANEIFFEAADHKSCACAMGILHSRVEEFLVFLRSMYNVKLVISTDKVEEYIAAACNRLGIACVQYAESEDVDALCSIAGIVPLTGVLDAIIDDARVGVCEKISVLRHTLKPSLHLMGIKNKRAINHAVVVPQLLIYASSKGVYKQYYNAVLKSLRVMRCLFADHHGHPCLRMCRGGGSTEMSLARWLLSEERRDEQEGSSDIRGRVVKQALSTALIESVAQLHANLTKGNGFNEQTRSMEASRRLLLQSMSRLGDNTFGGYIMESDHVISTKLGGVCTPTTIFRDPLCAGIIHPWERFNTVIRAALQTAEMLLKIDAVVFVKQNFSQETR